MLLFFYPTLGVLSAPLCFNGSISVLGVFVSRMRDQETKKQLSGLLEIGDEILEINGFDVKEADIMEVNRLMANKNSLLLTVLPYLCRKDV